MTSAQIIFLSIPVGAFLTPALLWLTLGRIWPELREAVESFYANLFGELAGNNNARATAFVVIAILLSISAFIGGFGRPLLTDEFKVVGEKVASIEVPEEVMQSFFWYQQTAEYQAKAAAEAKAKAETEAKAAAIAEAKADTAAKTKAEAGFFAACWRRLFGESKPTEAIQKEAVQVKEEYFPSWWNWIAAGLSWLVAIIYWPWSRRDELARGALRMLEQWQESRREARVAKASAPARTAGQPTTTSASETQPAKTPEGWSLKWDIFGDTVGSMLGEMLGSIITSKARR